MNYIFRLEYIETLYKLFGLAFLQSYQNRNHPLRINKKVLSISLANLTIEKRKLSVLSHAFASVVSHQAAPISDGMMMDSATTSAETNNVLTTS